MSREERIARIIVGVIKAGPHWPRFRDELAKRLDPDRRDNPEAVAQDQILRYPGYAWGNPGDTPPWIGRPEPLPPEQPRIPRPVPASS